MRIVAKVTLTTEKNRKKKNPCFSGRCSAVASHPGGAALDFAQPKHPTQAEQILRSVKIMAPTQEH